MVAALVALLVLAALPTTAHSQIRIDDLLKGMPRQPSGGSVGDVRIGEGLKEAVDTKHTMSRQARRNGV